MSKRTREFSDATTGYSDLDDHCYKFVDEFRQYPTLPLQNILMNDFLKLDTFCDDKELQSMMISMITVNCIYIQWQSLKGKSDHQSGIFDLNEKERWLCADIVAGMMHFSHTDDEYIGYYFDEDARETLTNDILLAYVAYAQTGDGLEYVKKERFALLRSASQLNSIDTISRLVTQMPVTPREISDFHKRHTGYKIS